jgi:hypothetical protein
MGFFIFCQRREKGIREVDELFRAEVSFRGPDSVNTGQISRALP